MARTPASKRTSKVKKSTKPTKKRSTRPRVRRARRRTNNISEYASMSVRRSLQQGQPPGPFLVNRMYDLHNISLDDYDRAVQVAKAYQFFRIKSAKITYKIGYDTYQAGAGAATRPNLYYMIDKSFSIPNNVTVEQMKAMGARPRVCDNKPVSITWSPAVRTYDNAPVGPLPSQYKISPWLSTNTAGDLGAFLANPTNHLGIYWYVQMDATGGVDYNYTAELEIQIEFKKPLWSNGTASVIPSVPAVPATLDDSPDGIVGGADLPTLSLH